MRRHEKRRETWICPLSKSDGNDGTATPPGNARQISAGIGERGMQAAVTG
ncbi:hypothetical protein PAMC26510_30030 [Caballeronia sordidicola]|uniref:Uncharacterized protein n=1 Tax=Caballeronia sordidicola TaxID=196367 RepID=A0A242M9L6_CABSO|nr:hypothetical protein PAMC26510_30030 [Caballeronia sordidicola]